MRLHSLIPLLLLLACSDPILAFDLEWIRVAEDGKTFERVESKAPFVPWGFNYDHNREGQLLEDCWDDDWTEIEADFEEMKALGANVVRIHLQFGKFMSSPTEPHQHALKQLARLVTLAEETGLYLNLTGLGCYHKQDVPVWYDQLSEGDRWSAQAEFWEVVAETCSGSPAVFCYDLMNEPVVPGGNRKRGDWLGPAFGDKHFVQFLALDRKQRQRSDIARNWIQQLVNAIRSHDERHLVTVGLVPWSLDRPGLTSGFYPQKVVDDLDFISVHLYPERGKADEAIETLVGFAAVPKPVVIEETFPLKCNAEELERFIDQSQVHAAGWIGFYWGQTPEELRSGSTPAEALTLSWLELFQRKAETITKQVAQPSTFRANGVTAHRGNSSEFPENTIPAFQSGMEVGADWIELDIFRTQDRKLVVIHDRTTERVGDQSLVVPESTYDELLNVDVATNFRNRTGQSVEDCPPHRIPLLKDVLLLVMQQNHCRVSIQPKMDCVADAVDLVQSLNAQQWVGFNDGNLHYMIEVKRLAPDIPVFWDRGSKTNTDEDIAVAKKHGFEALVIHQDGITLKVVQKVKNSGLEIGAWTVNDQETMAKLLDWGIDRIYTDRPRLLLKMMGEGL